MGRKVLIVLSSIFLICLLSPLSGYALMGDADGNGTVDIEDARCIARFLVNQIPAIPNPTDADTTQDGKIDMEDAFVIAKRVTGQSRIVIAAPRYGRSDMNQIGAMIRIEVFEYFAPFNITGGTVRIRSGSTGYDSGDQPLTFERNGRSLYYHWDTGGLSPASDYAITVTLNQSEGSSAKAYASTMQALSESEEPDLVTSLTDRVLEPPFLAAAVDAFCPAPGIPLEFRRVSPHDSAHYPYLGPLGRGWVHKYDICLEEYTDGRIAFHGPDGFNRFFESNADGTYTSSPGDYGVLTRDPGGTFQLKEKNGFIYHFRSDLRLNYEQDLNGNRITAIYGGSNRLVEIRHSCGNSFFLGYNTSGRIISLTDHAGRVTTYEYWPPTIKGLVAKHINHLLTQVTDPAGGMTEYVYSVGQSDVLNYRLLSVAFPDGIHVHYEYDSEAHLIKQTGTWGANPISYSYEEDGTTHITDALGGETTAQVNERGQPVSITDPDGAQTQMQYDTSANLTQVTDPLSHITQIDYDEFGNVVKTTNPLNEVVQFGYDLRFNKPSWITNPLGKTTSFEYDDKGNLTIITYPDPDSSQEAFGYDPEGNLSSIQDAAGETTEYSYNSQGLMTSLKNALGYTTQFSYDTAGDLERVTDAKEHIISHARDTLGRLTRRTYPDGSHEDYEYDAAGKVTAFINRRGEIISFSYDATGKLEWKEYPSGRKLRFRYDWTGYLSRVEKVVGETTTLDTAYERDAVHRITKVKVPGKTPPESYDVSYAYDAAGNRRFMAYPDGYSLNYEYDDADRLTRISDASDNTMVAYKYDDAGRREKRTLGNGTYTTYQYDDLDRLTLLVNYSTSGTIQSQFAYSYNSAGIRKSMTTLEGVHNYTYDDTYQLTGVVYPDGRTVDYSFDEVGNRNSVTDDGVVTDYATNELDQYTQAGSETFQYNANGNLTTRTLGADVTTYGWDEDDRLVSVDRGEMHVDYRYDHQWRLVAKTVGAQETRYIWDGLDLIAEVNSVGQVVQRYVYGAAINEIILVTADGANYWCQQDGLGSVVGTTNDSGAVLATCSYDVYGNVRSGDVGPVPQRFAGIWWDGDAGLYYVRARWYESQLGRFVSEELLRGLSIHRLLYCQNDPVNKVDLDGLLVAFVNRAWQYMKWSVQTGEVLRSFAFRIGQQYIRRSIHLDAYLRLRLIRKIKDWFKDFRRPFPRGWGFPKDPIDWWIAIPILAWDCLPGTTGLPRLVPGFPMRPPWGPPDDRNGWVWLKSPWGWYWAGGDCPTFVQGGYGNQVGLRSKDNLMCQVKSPWPKSLVRSDIPIFGIATSKAFTHYHVEYGEGLNPSEWHLIEKSAKPKEKAPDFKDLSWMQGDLDIRGNLATWNVGLKNWSHLPWHPPEDTTDLNGVYTLRLTVFGKNNEKIEDKVTVEVGRVIAQCLPGIATSPDKRVVMHFPEQALTHPFRIYTILPLSGVGEQTPRLPKAWKLIGLAYRIREPGDRFIKDVTLEFAPSKEEIGKLDPQHIGICQYDVEKEKWLWLETSYTEAGKSFHTILTELPTPKAIYTLVYDRRAKRSSRADPVIASSKPLEPARPGALLDNSFEEDFGTFQPWDRLVGATLSRDNKVTPDGSYCLKLVNENHGGDFSCTVLNGLFDVREYPVMSFDYRVGPDVKIDFFLKVNGRWYNLGFTDDPVDYRNRDVNIANLGWVEGIVADDKWHTASVDLRYLLHQQTRQTRIDEIVLADWDVGGYMKLEFGQNRRGATFYIDNFRILGPGTAADDQPFLLVDDFNAAKSVNAFGGPFGTYCNPGTRYIESSRVDVPPSGKPHPTATNRNRALRLTFDMTRPGAYGGYWTSLQKHDLSGHNSLRFRLKTESPVPPIMVGIRNAAGVEGKTLIAPYGSEPDKDGWRDVHVPLRGLRGLTEFSSPDVLFFSISHKDNSGKENIWINDLQFEQTPYARVADFESPFAWNLLGGNYATYQNGAAAISAASMPEITTGRNSNNTVCRISYGGTVGRDYGVNGGFSFARWECNLNGFDARSFSYLTLKIRGENGGETPNFYLSDANRRACLRTKEVALITQDWQEIRLPLAHYAEHGIDLSHLESLEIVFEWAEQSGTIYVDDVRFAGEVRR